jgi:uncharacterized protein YhdP
MSAFTPTSTAVSSAPAVALWLRALHRLATAALGLALLLWMLLLLAAGALYFWLIPNIDSLRPRVESFLSDQMHTPVQIERISVQSVQGFPTFDLHNLEILDTASQPQLKLAQVSVSVSPLSLLQFKAERWTLDAPQVHIRRDQQGVWSIAGIAADPNAKPGAALDWLFSQKEIVIERGHLTFQDDLLKQPERTFSDALLVIRNGLRSHSIRLEAKPDKAVGQSVRILGQFKQPLLDTHAGHWQAWAGELYAKLEAPQVAAMLPYLPANQPLLGATSLLSGTAQIEAWSKIEPSKLLAIDVAALHIPNIARRLQLHAQLDKKILHLQADQIDLTSSVRVAKAAGLAPAWVEYLDHAKPKGQIKTLKLDATSSKVSAKAELDSVDAAGTVEISLDPQQAQSLELKGQFARLDLTAIPRFLPEQLPLALRQ